ncbi:DUF4190 domain-containing protein [Paenibacillus spongiae]|uniref:DUF4190 domain-containing protein n=1 Tax=Paenibacillus spongiae TaxID=2909671 RepID=A0ABY5SDZ8_9BACL|nr:DUF4190 domain-containing protein [Paenibacillus spongiae]UVI32161.1 hypothetical protein L1F29_10235 [Paenibacillus spongiae]
MSMKQDRDSEFNRREEENAKLSRLDRERYKEEAAAEIAVPAQPVNSSARLDEAEEETRSAGRATGWAALILSIMSWFVWPVLLGITGAVVGFMAYRQGSRGLAVWSIALGLIAAAAYLVLIPLYYAVT